MHEQERLDKAGEVVNALSQIPGVGVVWRDDYDSVDFNIFLRLTPAKGHDLRHPLKFERSIRFYKSQITKVLKKLNRSWRLLDWPAPQYERVYVPVAWTGVRRETYKKGYDQTTIKIDVRIPA